MSVLLHLWSLHHNLQERGGKDATGPGHSVISTALSKDLK